MGNIVLRWRWAAGVMLVLGGFCAGLWGEEKGGAFPAFSDLPAATRQALEHQEDVEAVFPGTVGLALPGVRRVAGGARSIVILGDLSPTNEASAKYVREAVREVNLLSPEAVFTVGNLVGGMTRSGKEYASEVMAVRGELDRLKMPWYPCVGRGDVVSGERDGGDRRFEGLYKTYFGPLYYSVQCGGVHMIVLDSEEGVGHGSAISEAQLEWLKGDLKWVFEQVKKGGAGRTQQAVVLVHRPLWRDRESNWGKVHEALVAFNRKPIVTVEGEGAGAGPKVVAVYAGGTRAYADEGLVDGIRYTVLGATAARLKQDAAVEVRGFTVLKFDAGAVRENGAMHAAVVEMGGNGPGGAAAGTIVAGDVITASERAVLEKIEAIPNDVLGVVGVLEPSVKKDGELKLMLGNPLDVPISVEMRLASTRNLSTATLRENANAFAESFDAPWEFSAPYLARDLPAGVKEKYRMHLTMAPEATEVMPPQVEFVVHWLDGRGRVHDVLLKRRVPIVPHAEMTEAWLAAGADESRMSWDRAAAGGTFAWDLRGDEPKKASPMWEMTWNGGNLYVRVRVDDAVQCDAASKKLDWKWGGLAGDAVSVAWAGSAESSPESVKRVWVMPFGAKGVELWKNGGVGEKQTELVRMDENAGVKASVEKREDGYTVMMVLPRKMVMGDGAGCVMNIAVSDNDGGARTWVRSWAKEELGPEGWGRVMLRVPETQPASQPATRPRGKR